jgi:trigger factor
MEIKRKEHKGLDHTFILTLDKKKLDLERDNWLSNKARTYKKPGFRPGKVPLSLVQKEYGHQAEQDILRNQINLGIGKILKDNNIVPLRSPKVLQENILENDQIEYEVLVEQMPQFDIKEVNDIEITKLCADITDEEISSFIEKMQRLSGEFVEVDRAIESRDFVTVKYVVKKDKKIIYGDDNTQDRIDLVSPAADHKEVVKKIIGHKKGDKLSVKQESKILESEDKMVQIDYEILKIEDCKPHELNNDFFNMSGVDTIEDLRERFKTSLKNATDRMTFLYLKRQLLDALSKQYDFILPEALVEEEMKMISQKINSEKYEDYTDDVSDEDVKMLATRRVQLGLVIGKIAEQQKISVSNDNIISLMYQMALRNGENPNETLGKWVRDPGAVNFVKSQLLENAVIDYLIGKVKTQEKHVKVKELHEEVSEFLPSELYDIDSF